ncbi:GSCFA domain protein [Methyloversatilis universalis FAM5]|uniref:GSCFA domain protein n=1 Tax=Methyloversatilis universalis (strain ATCC BAA-1314 / DSM 25237 / JCM 13912 / CCUG 52030 / FAM5) TaxID=1000565 RepID=F5RFD3_METUF|nr:GSCFA domain-containing protein [Methyloversatilis universalis]EGK70785.1 GSCFA domain protein [Methyloversatilis universalis FAM5]
MPHPYSALPDSAFWSRTVGAGGFDMNSVPAVTDGFVIHPEDKVVSAGSCFAQHLARLLPTRGFRYLVTETGPEERLFGVYPARFGNVYTVRQLRQLFERAYGLFEPKDEAWRWGEVWVDPFRPNVEPAGFATREALLADRVSHLAAVRRMFEQCDVFVFTLGMTEAWVSDADGAVFPLAPGVHGEPEDGATCHFHNFSVPEMVDDLQCFVHRLRLLNPSVKLVLSVSPVSIAATYEPRHVLVSNSYTKAALRVVADMAVRGDARASYFPSYECAAGHHTAGRYFQPDMRHITPEGVHDVVEYFTRLYLTADSPGETSVLDTPPAQTTRSERDQWYAVWCDEELLAAP